MSVVSNYDDTTGFECVEDDKIKITDKSWLYLHDVTLENGKCYSDSLIGVSFSAKMTWEGWCTLVLPDWAIALIVIVFFASICACCYCCCFYNKERGRPYPQNSYPQNVHIHNLGYPHQYPIQIPGFQK